MPCRTKLLIKQECPTAIEEEFMCGVKVSLWSHTESDALPFGLGPNSNFCVCPASINSPWKQRGSQPADFALAI